MGTLKRKILSPCAAFCSLLAAASVFGQRASENTVSSAEDAFGTTVGNETIGLYTPTNTRGFSPVKAGNIRVEGLYFDMLGLSNTLVSHTIKRSVVRVGSNAQSYPFPAPTGIVDYELRLPQWDEQIASLTVQYGAYQSSLVEVDAQTPLIADKLALGMGIGGQNAVSYWGGDNKTWTGGAVMRYRPMEDTEIIPFVSYQRQNDWESNHFTFSDTVPPRIKRGRLFSQDWAQWDVEELNYGLIGRSKLNDAWTVQGGVFRSVYTTPNRAVNLFTDVAGDGTATSAVIVDPPQRSESYSGEFRATRKFSHGDTAHALTLSLRARDADQRFGGGAAIPIGTVQYGVPYPVAEPDYTLGPRSQGSTKQKMVGLSYAGQWQSIALQAGVQKVLQYDRRVDYPDGAFGETQDEPWLYNLSTQYQLNERISLFASYARGLEDAGVAPDNAVNRGEVLTASLTEQIDGGLRYTIGPESTLDLNVFEIEKPHFDLAASGLYRTVGTVRHRGAELSLSGRYADRLTVVLGAVLLNARTSTDAGGASDEYTPLGRVPRLFNAILQYDVDRWEGLSLDAQFNYSSSRVGNRSNTEDVDSQAVLNLGARYQFVASGLPMQLRFLAENLTDTFAWNVADNGSFTPLQQRRFLVRLVVDF